MHIRRSSSLITFTVLVTVISFLVPRASAAFKYLAEGMKAPAISGTDALTGEKVSSEEALKENLVLIVFWASWSERSLEQLQDLKELALEYADQPIKMFAVNVEAETLSEQNRARLVKLVTEMELPFPALFDEGLTKFYEFGVIAVPSTALLDTDGTLRYGPAGYSYTTRDHIIDSIEVLLGLREATADSVIVAGYRPAEKASRYYELALNLSHQRLYERALENIDLSIAEDTLFAAAHCLKGDILLSLRNPDSARAEYSSAVELDSQSIVGWTGLGESQLRLDSLEEAGKALERALALDSVYTPALLLYGLCQSQRGDDQGAMLYLQRASDLNARDPQTLYYLGRVRRAAGDSAGAVQSFLKALETLFPER